MPCICGCRIINRRARIHSRFESGARLDSTATLDQARHAGCSVGVSAVAHPSQSVSVWVELNFFFQKIVFIVGLVRQAQCSVITG